MLSEQLKELLDYGFVEKKTYEGYPLRVEYFLTEDMGMQMLEAIKITQRIGIDYMKKHGMYFNGKWCHAGVIPTKKWVIYIFCCSLPFQAEELPEQTKSLALVLEDKDAYPVTGGFAWIHWLAADITRWELKEDESRIKIICMNFMCSHLIKY